jgi:hypothetical protein
MDIDIFIEFCKYTYTGYYTTSKTAIMENKADDKPNNSDTPTTALTLK